MAPHSRVNGYPENASTTLSCSCQGFDHRACGDFLLLHVSFINHADALRATQHNALISLFKKKKELFVPSRRGQRSESLLFHDLTVCCLLRSATSELLI